VSETQCGPPKTLGQQCLKRLAQEYLAQVAMQNSEVAQFYMVLPKNIPGPKNRPAEPKAQHSLTQ